MFNNLLADSLIREKYQFWFFMYPTGNPILYSSSILRGSLKEARQVFDPEGDDQAFDHLILVGHSMGGLLSKYMILNSRDEVWKEFSDVPFSDLSLTPDQRRLAESVFFFEPIPFVSRVVFIATPHRGSELASGRIGRWGASLVKLPSTLVNNSYAVLRTIGQDEQHRLKMKLESMPTGVDGLKPDSPFVRMSERIPLLDEIPYHSIIGNNEAADTPSGTDGIVPYESSHLDGAVSEIIVRSGHSAHNHPLAIQEVRRILHEHLETFIKHEESW
jgi:triacylglycerol esterase/lipase EstA (alpha/beta hydrolase family)